MILTASPYLSVLLVLIAILPGLVSWGLGRTLTAHLDDPVLPERLAAYQRRNGVVLVVACVSSGVLSPLTLWWTLPVTFGATFVGAFPLRQALFGESWTLLAYLSFFGRLYVALFGLWILLAAAPALASAARDAAWIVAIVTGAALFLWHDRYADVLRFIMRTRPVEEGAFLDRCRTLASACGLPQPRFERIDLHGGAIANALALPSLRGSSVLFTDTLLARLNAEEAAAICAHELAHLEHYDRRRLRRLNIVGIALIALSILWTPLFRAFGVTSGWTGAIWLIVLTGALIPRARDKQRQETVCDARAATLVGADPTISALTRLYTIARIPRRVQPEQDRSGTHPSLARRIRDIRNVAGASPASLVSDTAFTSSDGKTVVTFEASALRWSGGDAITWTIDYSRLTELRIDAGRGRTPRLLVRGPQAQRWEMALADADLGRAQSVLDVVDGRLAEGPLVPAIPVKLSRIATAAVTLVALIFGHVSLALVALLAAVRFAAPLLAAAATAALAVAAITLRGAPSGFDLIVALMFTAIASTFLGAAWVNRKNTETNTRLTLVVLGLHAVLAVASLALNGIDSVRLHQAALVTPSAVVWPIALAGALACFPARRARIAALAAVLVAAVTTLVGSSLFLDYAADDPFLVEAPHIRWIPVDAQVVDEFRVPTAISRLRLSPNGRTVAALQQVETGDDPSWTFHFGRAGGPLLRVSADDVLFVDDEHILAASSDVRGTTLQTLAVEHPGQPLWQHRVDDVVGASLSVDRRRRRWQLTGWSADEGMARAEGLIGSADAEVTRWPAGITSSVAVNAFTTSGADALVVETRYEEGLFTGFSHRWQLMLMLMQRYNQESRYWRVRSLERVELGTSRLGAECHAGILPGSALVCAAYDGTRTRIFSLNADGEICGLVSVDGRFAGDENSVHGWLSGWADSTPVAIRLATGEAFRPAAQDGYVTHLTASADRLAAVTFGARGPTIRTYPLRNSTATGTARR